MASEVDISNMALSHLGDSATVASIDPPEGSAQAEHCAKWYPIARNAMLEMHEWNFATTRAVLAELVNPFPQWRHAYARPTDCLRVLVVLPSDARADVAESFPSDRFFYGAVPDMCTIYTPQDFTTEIDAGTGNQIILTNQLNAMVRYTRLVTDTSKFTPLFTIALARLLASYLAGPVLKGTDGIQVGQAQLQIAQSIVAQAAVSSANQSAATQVQAFPWSR